MIMHHFMTFMKCFEKRPEHVSVAGNQDVTTATHGSCRWVTAENCQTIIMIMSKQDPGGNNDIMSTSHTQVAWFFQSVKTINLALFYRTSLCLLPHSFVVQGGCSRSSGGGRCLPDKKRICHPRLSQSISQNMTLYQHKTLLFQCYTPSISNSQGRFVNFKRHVQNFYACK